MRSLVVDASVAIKWFNPTEALARHANLIRADYAEGRVALVVPAFWDYEMVSGINKAVARGDLNTEEGREAVRLIVAVEAQRIPLPSPSESYELAQRYQRSIYDSWYVALAQRSEVSCGQLIASFIAPCTSSCRLCIGSGIIPLLINLGIELFLVQPGRHGGGCISIPTAQGGGI